MHLIGTLAAGVRGGESGTAQLRRRGTSSPATYYDSAEAETQFATGTVSLDQYGGAAVYVNEPVDVTVFDEQGATVRTFTEMGQATAVEVISPSFTGRDYEDASTGSSKPVKLSSVLDLWFDSAGATDWKVRMGSETLELENALGRGAGVFFNVRAPEYGAAGDSVIDDTAAINAAATAAGANGTLFFPAGTYRVTSTLNVTGGQTWLLAPGASISSSGFATAMIAVSGGSATSKFYLRGGNLTSSASHAGSLLTSTRAVVLEDVVQNGTFTANGIVTDAGIAVYLRRVSMSLAGTTSKAVSSSSGQYTSGLIDDCSFTMTAVGYSSRMVDISAGRVANNTFTSTDGTVSHSAVRMGATGGGSAEVIGNTFNLAGGAGTTVAVDGSELTGSNVTTVFMAGNTYGVAVNRRVVAGAGYTGMRHQADLLSASLTSGTTTTIDSTVYGDVYYNYASASGNVDFSMTGTDVPDGASLNFVLLNSSGGPVNLAFIGGGVMSLYPTGARLVVADGLTATLRFVKIDGKFYQIGAAAVGTFG